MGQAFYRPWLDVPSMTYTCAYWKEGTRTLEEAQRNKMDHVCRKVQLKAGESFVDVGSGWGGLLLHAWEHYGAIGTGINTTTEQVVESRAEIARRGLADTLKVVECDFREIPGRYDKLLSIGTLEHAGRDQLPDVVRAHADALKPGGLGVIHFIGHVDSRDTEFYIREYIFPGRLDPEPRRGDRLHGALRAGGGRRREPAPPLRADARRLGRALRPPTGTRSTRSTRSASTSACAAPGAPTCGRAPSCSAPSGRRSGCSR